LYSKTRKKVTLFLVQPSVFKKKMSINIYKIPKKKEEEDLKSTFSSTETHNTEKYFFEKER